MPANLPPDYYSAERRFRSTSDVSEKIQILREMMAIMPKHKGTEHLQGDLKRKIAKLQAQADKKHVQGRSSGLDHIPHEGAGQAVLVGSPNSGKSSLLNQLTHAHSPVAEYPFSTFKPVQGMMDFEDVQIQLIDMPPMSPNYTEYWMFNIIRLADLVLLLVDLSVINPQNQVSDVCTLLEEHKIELRKEGENRPQGALAVKSTMLVGMKKDVGNQEDKIETVRKTISYDLPYFTGSTRDLTDMHRIRKSIYDAMCIIRIYTKTPGKKTDYEKPYILPAGATVVEAAGMIHKDLSETMKFARIWGSEKYDGQRVDRLHVLEDKDVLEIHTR
jgi:ribosome-interacting GTPase 1